MTVADFTAKDVKALRDRTGAGMMDCKRALEEADGDSDKAVEILRVKGPAKADKRAERGASEGIVESYIHATGKIGVLVEVNCETDFVARTDDFKEFAREVAQHIAALRPRVGLRGRGPARTSSRARSASSSRRPPTSRSRRARRSSRASCASGSRRPCCCTRST